jgi:hypothetical protein
MSAIHQVLLAGSGAGYQIANSLRFRASNSAYLSRTGSGSPTSTTTFTYSVWVKLGATVAAATDFGELLSGYTASNDSGYCAFEFNTASGAGTLRLSGWGTVWRVTTAVYRDPSAWYHVVLAVDTTQATAANRIKIYINGSEVTSFSTSNNPGLNATIGINNASTALRIGSDNPASSSRLFDGLMANPTFVDGQALTPSSFGQTDATTGVWVPKSYSGTYGTNGFFLQFKDATSTTTIGYDTSGNANNFTTSGISVTSGVTFDQMLDTPTLNYAVLNAVDLSSGSLSAANMQWALNAGSARRGTFGMKSGKWYFECAITSGTNPEYFAPGIQLLSGAVTGYGGTSQVPSGYGYLGVNGNKLTGSTGSAYGSAFTTNDVISVAFDADAGKIWFAKNGTWQASGDPAAGTNAAFSSITSGDYFPYISNQTTANNDHAGYVNFGQRPFSYTPPTGFKALNTANLASTAVSTSGTFTGNASADGPFVWTNGNPATLTINGNAVTFGTHADKTAGGFKLRSSSSSYNASGSNTWTATAGKRFVQVKKPNNAQVNP